MTELPNYVKQHGERNYVVTLTFGIRFRLYGNISHRTSLIEHTNNNIRYKCAYFGTLWTKYSC